MKIYIEKGLTITEYTLSEYRILKREKELKHKLYYVLKMLHLLIEIKG